MTLRDEELRFLVSQDFLLSLAVAVACVFEGEQAVLRLVVMDPTVAVYAACDEFARLLEFVPCVNPAYSCHAEGAAEG